MSIRGEGEGELGIRGGILVCSKHYYAVIIILVIVAMFALVYTIPAPDVY